MPWRVTRADPRLLAQTRVLEVGLFSASSGFHRQLLNSRNAS